MHANSRLRHRNMPSFKIYLRFLSLTYFIGFIFHLADIFDLRLIDSKMDKICHIECL